MWKKSGSGGNRCPSSGWREYQAKLQKQGSLERSRRLRLTVLVLALAALCGVYSLMGSTPAPSAIVTSSPATADSVEPQHLDKEELRQLLDKDAFNNLTREAIDMPLGQRVVHVETSLDPGLQKYLLDRMDRKNSRVIGIVVMEAGSGRVLAMAGFDEANPSVNTCLRSTFPSASVFKIVTAASAVDHCGLSPDSKLHFNGGRYTLYKRQLKDIINRYTNTVSFKQAFAQSVDPVFRKLGEHRLGRPVLKKYADTFGFNEPLNFDLPLKPSHFHINDEPYHWAELSSGFNRDTTISPLHGAVMVSAVLNDGRMVTPSLVDRIVTAKGQVLYRHHRQWEQQAMSPKASAVLDKLMQATVASGTAHHYFRGYRHDRILSHLVIGGKTGTIDNRDHDARYDWFVGFAKERKGDRQVVVAALVAHGKYIGTRASQYARMAIRYYFSQPAPQPATAAQPGG